MVQRQSGGGGARCGDRPAGPGERVSRKKEKEKGSWAVGAGLGQGEWCWAVAWGLGRSVKELAREGKRENGPQWRFAGPNWVWVVFLISISISNPNYHTSR